MGEVGAGVSVGFGFDEAATKASTSFSILRDFIQSSLSWLGQEAGLGECFRFCSSRQAFILF